MGRRRRGLVMAATVVLAGGLAGCSATPAATVASPAPPAPPASHSSPAAAPSLPPASSATARTPGTTTRTRSVVLEPVRRSGRPSSGWLAAPAAEPITCRPAEPSPAAVAGSVLSCGASATLSDTCWASTVRTVVLCLPDPWSRRLTRFAVSDGQVPTVRPRPHRMPLGLELADGLHCRLRDGGSWSVLPQHQDWLGYYSCPVGATFSAVYGPAGAPIDTSASRWTVHLANDSGAVTTVAVVRAYYVATAP